MAAVRFYMWVSRSRSTFPFRPEPAVGKKLRSDVYVVQSGRPYYYVYKFDSLLTLELSPSGCHHIYETQDILRA